MSIYAGKVSSKKIAGKIGEESQKLNNILKKARKPASLATRTKRLVKKFLPKRHYRKFEVVDIEELAKKQGLKPNLQLFAEEGKELKLAQYGDDFGKIGKYIESPNVKLDWSKSTNHGLERMNQRGITSAMIEDFVNKGKVLSQDNGNRFAYITKDGVAVVSKDGKLITAWTSANFDSNMFKIVKSLFGE